MWGVEWLVILVMVVLNAVFAAYEIALVSVSAGGLQLMVRQKRAGARASLLMKEKVAASLAAVQLGITLVGAIAAATGGAGAVEMILPRLQRLGLAPGAAEFAALALVVVPLSAIMIVCGELLPKVFALRNKEWVCLRLSPVMHWFAIGMWPAVRAFELLAGWFMRWGERRWQRRLDAFARLDSGVLQELHAIAALARTSRLIGGREEGIILGAAKLSRRPVREIMLPTDDIAMLNLNDSLSDSLTTAHLEMHTRFPVAERPKDAQSIVGYANFKDIVAQLRSGAPEQSLRAVLRPILSLEDSLPIAECLERLIREHTHIALVRDAAGRVVGMITLEDIMEELVGEIQDEYDRLPGYAFASGPGWLVGGGTTLEAVRELVGIDLASDLPRPHARNFSDWITGHLGRRVRGGDVIERHDVRVLVRKVRRQRVLEAEVNVSK